MDNDELRRKAQELLTDKREQIPTQEIGDLLQELEIHQIELELQNAELVTAQAENETLRQRYFDLYMFAPVGYVIVNPNGQILDANLNACQLIGKERKFVINTPLAKYFTSGSREQFFDLLNTVFEREIPQQIDLTLRTPENTHVAVSIQTFNEDGQQRARLTLTNITARVLAEQEREELSARYRVMFEQSNAIKLVVDPETNKIVDANTAASEFYGYTKQALLGISIKDICDRARDRPILSDGITDWRCQHKLANGERREVEVLAGPITLKGKVHHYLIVHDITEQIQQENERRLLWHAINQSSSSVVITDTQGRIEYVNPYFTEITGYTLDEAIGQNPSILKSGNSSPDVYADLWDTIRSGETWHGEFHNQTKSGDTFWERASISPLYDSDGQHITHYVAIKDDITHQKALEQQLIQSARFTRNIVDALSAQIIILDQTGCIVDANAAWRQFSSQAADEDMTGIGANYLDRLSSIDPETERGRHAHALRTSIERVLRNESDNLSMAYPYPHDGKLYWFDTRITCFRGDAPTRVVIAHEDITERMLATNQLTERLKELNILYEQTKLFEVPDISMEEILQGTVDMIPEAWHYPDITSARLTLYDVRYTSAQFAESPWRMHRSLIIHDKYVGELEIFYSEQRPEEYEGPFLKDERRLLEELANRLEEQIAARESEAHIQLQADTQAALLNLFNSNTPDEESFIEATLEEAVRLTNSEIGYFHFVNAGGINLNMFKWSKGVMEMCTAAPTAHYPLNEAGIWADCVRTGRPAVHNDYANLPNRQGLPDGHFPLARHLSVPIHDNNRPVAIIGVGNKATPYDDYDIARLTLMSTTLWFQIEHKRAEELIKRQNHEMRTINRVISLSTSTLDTNYILDIACRELSSALEARVVMIATHETHPEPYTVIAVSDNTAFADLIGQPVLGPDDAIVNHVERYGIPYVTTFDKLNIPLHNFNPTQDMQSVMLIPLKVEGELYGIFCACYNKSSEAFSDTEIGFAANVVHAMSRAFENGLLHQQVTMHNQRLGVLVEERTAQLQRMNQRMTTVLNNVRNPVILVDSDGLIDITNPAFSEQLGYDADERYNQPLWEMFAEEDRHTLTDTFKQLTTDEQVQPIQARVTRKDGTQLDVEVSLSHVSGTDGRAVCTLYDISHLKEIERIKDEFISMVSHELRTPLTSILLSSSTMKNHYERLSDAQKIRKIDQLHHQAEILTELVTAVLDISRFDARQGKAGDLEVNISEALRTVIDEVQPMINNKRQTLDVTHVEGCFTLTGEPSDIERIWRNVISNAVKYTPANGHITVELYGACADLDCRLPDLSRFGDDIPDDLGSGRYAIGLVTDNGPGMSAQDQAHLFTRFYRGWAASTTIPGTGLGLSFVKDLLAMYNGDIAVYSVPDEGSSFCFWLPVYD